MSEVAQGEVPIFPTFRGFRAATVSEIDATADTAGRSFGDRFLGAAKTVGNTLAAGITAAAGVAAVGVGAIFKKGLDRGLNIQDATKQLEGLGHSAESVQTIMGNALASVKGTAFGLDTAATLAASVVAAGVKPGEELERVLKLTADAATIAKTPLNEMGDIINKVASSGKLNTEVLQQFSQRGVPLLQFVAKEYGVTADEASKMVSRGEVDFATFQRLIENNLGGAALKSGETARGAWKNIGAAWGRLGAMFTGGAVNAAPSLFTSIANAVDRAGAALKPYSESFNALVVVGMGKLQSYIDTIDFDAVISKVRSFIVSVQSAFGSISAGFQSGDFSGVGGAFADVLAIARPMVPLFVELGKGIGAISGSVGQVLAAGLPLLVPILQGFANVLTFLGDNPALLAAALIAVAGAFVIQRTAATASLALVPLQIAADIARTAALVANTNAARANAAATVTNTAAARADFLTRLPATASIIAAVPAYVASTAAMVAQRVAMLAGAAASGIATAAQWAFNAALTANPIGLIIAAIVALVAGLIWFFTQTELGQEIWANFTRFLTEAWNNIMLGAQIVFGAIAAYLSKTWNDIVAFIQGAVDFLVQLFLNWTPLGIIIDNFGAISTFLSDTWNNIVSFIQQAVDFLIQLFLNWTPLGIIISNFGAIQTFFVDLWNNITSTVSNGIGTVVGFFQRLPGDIMRSLGNLGTMLLDSGKALVQGFIDGIKAMAGNVGDAIGGVLDFVSGFFPRSPAKRGPFSGAGWTRVSKSGAALMREFTDGAAAEASGFDMAMTATVVRRPIGAGSGPVDAPGGGSAASGIDLRGATITAADTDGFFRELSKKAQMAKASQGGAVNPA